MRPPACSGTPLANAAAAGHLEVVELLLASGADPNLPERNIAPDGHALYAAVANRHIEIVKTLLEHGARANPEVESSADALTRAISNDDQAMIDLLCSYGASRKPHLLAHYGDVRTAAALFTADAALADDPGALASAAGEGHEPFVRLMLRYVPNLARKVVLPPWQPSAKTQPLAEFLYRNGLDPNKADWLGITSLHQFARLGDIENMRLALAHGADLSVRDDDQAGKAHAQSRKAQLYNDLGGGGIVDGKDVLCGECRVGKLPDAGDRQPHSDRPKNKPFGNEERQIGGSNFRDFGGNAANRQDEHESNQQQIVHAILLHAR